MQHPLLSPYESQQIECISATELHDLFTFDRYQVALGSTPGGTQIHPFEDISSGALSTVINYLDLSHQRRVFATVKGYNAAGLHSTSTSNGVYVSRISAGLEPLGVSYVYDGSDANKDL